MLWWSLRVVNMRLLGLEHLIQEDRKQALLSQDVRFTGKCKDSLSSPPHDLFLHKHILLALIFS